MSKVIFNLKGQETTILCKNGEKLREILKRFAAKNQKNMNTIYLIYDGNIVNEEEKFEEIIKEEDKERKTMNILVEEIEEFQDLTNENLFKSNDIICPKCKENILIEFKDYKINLSQCKNGHELNDLSIKDFERTQYLDKSHIICNFCKEKNKGNTFNNDFYYCFTCKDNICPLCQNKHDKSHKIIKYENKDNLCDIHKEGFIKYCYQCHKNLCMKCENEHKNHNLKYFGEILPSDEKINEINELKSYLDKFNNDIKNIIKKLEDVKEYINLYYNICNNYIEYNKNNRNYQILMNINEFISNNNNILNEMKNIILENNINNKVKYILNISDKIDDKNNINNINDILKNEASNYIIAELDIDLNNLNSPIKIINSFEQFKKENDIKNYITNEEEYFNENEIKDNCLIKINGDIIPFSYYYKFTVKGKNKIEYIFTKKLKNINYMFFDCNF